jgi:transcriptional regulator with XRE-family HTH domain
MDNHIAKLRRAAGLSQQELADKIGTKYTMLGKLERGERELTSSWLTKLSDALGCAPADILADTGVPVVGYIGAGATVHAFKDTTEAHLEYVDRPPMVTGDLVAAEVRGASMLPVAEEGWHIIWHNESTLDEKAFLNRLCVAQLADETILVKRIVQGTKTGHYHLLSTNAAPILDAQLLWAAVVKAIIPS